MLVLNMYLVYTYLFGMIFNTCVASKGMSQLSACVFMYHNAASLHEDTDKFIALVWSSLSPENQEELRDNLRIFKYTVWEAVYEAWYADFVACHRRLVIDPHIAIYSNRVSVPKTLRESEALSGVGEAIRKMSKHFDKTNNAVMLAALKSIARTGAELAAEGVEVGAFLRLYNRGGLTFCSIPARAIGMILYDKIYETAGRQLDHHNLGTVLLEEITKALNDSLMYTWLNLFPTPTEKQIEEGKYVKDIQYTWERLVSFLVSSFTGGWIKKSNVSSSGLSGSLRQPMQKLG